MYYMCDCITKIYVYIFLYPKISRGSANQLPPWVTAPDKMVEDSIMYLHVLEYSAFITLTHKDLAYLCIVI